MTSANLEKLCSLIVMAVEDAALYHSKIHGNFKYHFGRVCGYDNNLLCKEVKIDSISPLTKECSCDPPTAFFEQWKNAIQKVRPEVIATVCHFSLLIFLPTQHPVPSDATQNPGK